MAEQQRTGKAGRSVRWRTVQQRSVLSAVAAVSCAVPLFAVAAQPASANPAPPAAPTIPVIPPGPTTVVIPLPPVAAPGGQALQQVIVESSTPGAALTHVSSAGGRPLTGLSAASAEVADVTPEQAATLTADGDTVVPNLSMLTEGVPVSATPGTAAGTITPTHAPSGVFPQVTGASTLVQGGDTGAGATVAVLDTGIDANLPDLAGRVIDGVDLSGEGNPYLDSYGHGTFVAGLIASSGASSDGQYVGEAPGADLVSVKVAGANGLTSEATVIEGIDWVIAHQSSDHIGVLNISLGTAEVSPTGADPIDRAVEAAWLAGITVVTSAGNSGPSNGTITSPGDDPLVITAGAMDDGGATNPAGYSIPSFSGVGPTLYDAWYKPDLVAPGRSVVSLADPGSTIYQANPSAEVGASNFVGSGTSFSSAITSGAAALLLADNPNLTPDAIKARLLGTASAGPVGSPFVDGHGVLNVAAAAVSTLGLSQVRASAAEHAPPSKQTPLSRSWSSSTWNGAAWNGAAWNGAAWNGAAWNGAAWNGAAWNGAAWNGAAWNGAAWNGAAWNGAAWNGAAWN